MVDFKDLVDVFDEIGLDGQTQSEVVNSYMEPHRHYHTLDHVYRLIEMVPADHPFRKELLAACVFHDVVYDPKMPLNEAASVNYFLESSVDGSIDDELVMDMILATRHHEPTGRRVVDEFLKMDLSILWADDPAEYLSYLKGIRKEYDFVSWDKFTFSRLGMLGQFWLEWSHRLEADQAEAMERNFNLEMSLYGAEGALDMPIVYFKEKHGDRLVIEDTMEAVCARVLKERIADTLGYGESVWYGADTENAQRAVDTGRATEYITSRRHHEYEDFWVVQ